MVGSSDYGLSIRGAVRALWKGLIDADQFYDWMSSAIARGLTKAWYAGAAECGIQPSELSPIERNALQSVIAEETNQAPGFAAAIINGSQQSGGKLTPQLNRAKMWIARWADVNTRARVMACEDKPFKWVVDHAKESCSSCLRLEGKVKRGSYWHAQGILPRVPDAWYLLCRGFYCGCDLVVTTERCSPGPLPKLP